MQVDLKQPQLQVTNKQKIFEKTIEKQILLQLYFVVLKYKGQKLSSTNLPKIIIALTFRSQTLSQLYYNLISIHLHNKSPYIQEYDNIMSYKCLNQKRFYFEIIAESYRFSLNQLLSCYDPKQFPQNLLIILLRSLLEAYRYMLYLMQKYPQFQLNYEINHDVIYITREYNFIVGCPLIPKTIKSNTIKIKDKYIKTDIRKNIQQCLISLIKNQQINLSFFINYPNSTDILIQNQQQNIQKWIQQIYKINPNLQNQSYQQKTYQFLKKATDKIEKNKQQLYTSQRTLNNQMIKIDSQIFQQLGKISHVRPMVQQLPGGNLQLSDFISQNLGQQISRTTKSQVKEV